ncbi:hypothetical protein ACJJTC_008695, partial [Scirpophaga incertulas]
PGSTVFLRTSAETDLAGNDRVIAVADYDTDNSRPSTPGGDTSGADLLDDVKEKKSDVTDVAEDWDCVFEGGFGAAEMSASPGDPGAAGPAAPGSLLRRLTALTLSIRLHDFDPLTIVCPQRNVSKLHALHPSKNNTRYYVVVERTTTYNQKRIVVRSPLQIRNETSYALEVLYVAPSTEEGGAGSAQWLEGALANPFDGKRRLAVIEPHAVCNLPLHVAYHCRLYLAPSNFESFRTQTTEAIWWKELANDVGSPRDLLCPASDGDDNRAFALRIIPVLDVTEKNINLTTECDKDSGDGRRLLVSLKVERHDSWQLLFHAQYWFINKTGLPLQIRVTLSELCPQLTKIVTLLPYFVVCNDTRRHLRYMEQDEAADLWLDLAPQQVGYTETQNSPVIDSQ